MSHATLDASTAQATAPGGWTDPVAALSRAAPRSITGAPARQSEAAMRFGFRIGRVGLLLANESGGQVVESPVVYPVPNAAPWFRGLLNLRGNLVPVFDLAPLLDTDGAAAHLLVIGRGDEAAGLLINALPVAVALVEPLSQTPAAPGPLREHVRSAYLWGDEVWFDADIGGFLEAISESMALA